MWGLVTVGTIAAVARVVTLWRKPLVETRTPGASKVSPLSMPPTAGWPTRPPTSATRPPPSALPTPFRTADPMPPPMASPTPIQISSAIESTVRRDVARPMPIDLPPIVAQASPSPSFAVPPPPAARRVAPEPPPQRVLREDVLETFLATAVAPIVAQLDPIAIAPPARSRRQVDARWHAAGERVRIAGYEIAGGLLYVGSRLTAVSGDVPEPALINPELRVGLSGDALNDSLTYWPSYDQIAPAARARYLAWLADGRRDPTIPTGYVFLFVYGLERRLLADPSGRAVDAAEATQIAAEIERLLTIYGTQGSIRRYGRDLLALARFLGALPLDAEEPSDVAPGEISFATRLALGALVAAGRAVPSTLALRWVGEHRDTVRRTPVLRCAAEFSALFVQRYAEGLGAGIELRARPTAHALKYRPASASFGGPVSVTPTVPDVADDARALTKLRQIYDACATDLEAFSRWVGRNSNERESLEAAALLPHELLDQHAPAAFASLRAWSDASLEDARVRVVPAEQLLRKLPQTVDGKPTRAEALAVAQLLERCGVGLEPDVRFGGGVPSRGTSIVLFRLPAGKPLTAPSPAYAGALTMLALAVTVAAADGAVSDEEEQQLVTHLESGLDLPAFERARLRAHLRLLLLAPPKLTKLKKRLAELDRAARTSIAQFLVVIAGADGRLDPGEIKALLKIYPLLGLDPNDVYRDVHALSAAPTAMTSTATPAAVVARDGVNLDLRRVQAKIEETAAVSALLGGIFAEEEPPTATPGPAPTTEAVSTARGLDAAHAALLRALAGRPQWTRVEVEALAARHGLLTDGALEALNDAAFAACDEPVCEGDDPLEINANVLKELMA